VTDPAIPAREVFGVSNERDDGGLRVGEVHAALALPRLADYMREAEHLHELWHQRYPDEMCVGNEHLRRFERLVSDALSEGPA
jgi:hypothetical protein